MESQLWYTNRMSSRLEARAGRWSIQARYRCAAVLQQYCYTALLLLWTRYCCVFAVTFFKGGGVGTAVFGKQAGKKRTNTYIAHVYTRRFVSPDYLNHARAHKHTHHTHTLTKKLSRPPPEARTCRSTNHCRRMSFVPSPAEAHGSTASGRQRFPQAG